MSFCEPEYLSFSIYIQLQYQKSKLLYLFDVSWLCISLLSIHVIIYFVVSLIFLLCLLVLLCLILFVSPCFFYVLFQMYLTACFGAVATLLTTSIFVVS